MSSIIFSGIQPSGVLHIGNYLGAIKNWVEMFNAKDCKNNFIFSVVDLHAITVYQNPEELKKSIYKTIATYIACGLDYTKDNLTLFVQSSVKEHSELAWLLACNAPTGFLNRMTQYKSKTQDNKERECLGLYAYPVLMAADILLYNTDIVPVGEDQVQHIELTRDIAEKINSLYKQEVFKLPKYLLTKDTKRIMSLKDGLSKMSKSSEDEASRINLDDSPGEIAKKIKKSATDSITGIYEAKGRDCVNNLIAIFAGFSCLTKEEVSDRYKNTQTSSFKADLIDLLTLHIAPISSKIKELEMDRDFLDTIIKNGGEKASEIACKNIKRVKQIIGLY
jgi:tryptophanyl-tRNA synthetase